ncbi:MAG TPA: hypothetical protein VNZ45_15620 [Bacteroidia bacterium]|jgi:hypothetical protein|nr:hypothetical protein [Bacteroidia bacterium]
MTINNSQVIIFGTELSAAMTGSPVLIGTLPHPVTHLIFDNQGTVSVALYVNGTSAANLWRTFPGGEAIVLDIRDANGIISQGTTFYGDGASGTFSISYNFVQPVM